MRIFASIVVLSGLVGCASGDISDHPSNPEIQREIVQIVQAVRQESGAALYSDLRRLVAYDVFAVEQMSKLAEDPNARLRSNAMWVIAQVHDPERPRMMDEVDSILRRGLKDGDQTVRLEAAAGLASRGAWDVLPILIEGLDNNESSVRVRCHEQLVTTTSKDFGYQVDAPEDDRKAAAERWRRWYEGWQRTRS
jgi:HEAT repeat protein